VCSVVLTVNSQTKSIKSQTQSINEQKYFIFLSVLYVILMIFFVNSLLKQQSTQLPAMKAVNSHENFKLCCFAEYFSMLSGIKKTLDFTVISFNTTVKIKEITYLNYKL
jgi:hypothetical protein